MTLKLETLEADFKVSAVGTLVTGQWFAKNADISKVPDEYPMLLVTGGLLHRVRICVSGNRREADQLMSKATDAIRFLTFGGQVRITEHCHQFLICSS
jgi:hypothetical protein